MNVVPTLGQRLLAQYEARANEWRARFPDEMVDFSYEVPDVIVAALNSLPTPHHACMGEWQFVQYPEGPTADLTFRYEDAAPHWQYMEVLESPPVKIGTYDGGEGYLWLYRHPSRDDVLYLVETDGESGTHLAVRFGAR
jgi:hypothetical protein